MPIGWKVEGDETPPRVEPSSDLRQAAKALRQMFQALIDEGFTDHQALVIIGQVMAANRPTE